MKELFNKSIIGVASSVISTLIIYLLTLISNNIKQFLIAKTFSNYLVIILFIILVSVIVNLIFLLKRKNKIITEKTTKIKEYEDIAENYAKKKGYKLYKNFAYYKPDEDKNTLYCKPCMDDRRLERELQKSGTNYTCSSCHNIAIDIEEHNRIRKEAEQKRRETKYGLL